MYWPERVHPDPLARPFLPRQMTIMPPGRCPIWTRLWKRATRTSCCCSPSSTRINGMTSVLHSCRPQLAPPLPSRTDHLPLLLPSENPLHFFSTGSEATPGPPLIMNFSYVGTQDFWQPLYNRLETAVRGQGTSGRSKKPAFLPVSKVVGGGLLGLVLRSGACRVRGWGGWGAYLNLMGSADQTHNGRCFQSLDS